VEKARKLNEVIQLKKEAELTFQTEKLALSLIPKKLLIGNTYEKLDDDIKSTNKHKWKIYVSSADGDDLNSCIQEVEFVLHPTFFPPTLICKHGPFEVSRLGWGSFQIGVNITWKNGKKSDFKHDLCFDNPVTENSVDVILK